MSKRIKSLVLLAVMLILVSASGDKDEKSEKPPEKKITLAVYPIKMAGADKALEVPLTQILIREISQSAMLTVLEEDMISEVLKKQGFANSDLCDNTQCQISIGKLTPAQKLVTPVLSKLGDKFILDLKVTDIQTGAVDFVASRQKVCKEDELDQLASEAALELRVKFGEKVELPQSAQPQSSPASPSSPPSSGAALDSQNILGIVVEDLSASEKRNSGGRLSASNLTGGVRVKSVSPDSPCKDIFKPGNVITYLNPQGPIQSGTGKAPWRISDLNDFRKQVASITPGASVGVAVLPAQGMEGLARYLNCVIPSSPQTNPQTSATPAAPTPPEKKAKR